MIWTCQFGAVVRWMQENNIDATSKTPIDTARGEMASTNTTRVTGADSNDLLNNVYDSSAVFNTNPSSRLTLYVKQNKYLQIVLELYYVN